MTAANPSLPYGYSPVPKGAIATLVTYLEMAERPPPRSVPGTDETLSLVRLPSRDLRAYRDLFMRVGAEWLWESRLIMPDAALHAILDHPDVEAFAFRCGDAEIGLLELDFRHADECELAFFGLVGDAVGQGVGRYLMEQAIDKAWSRPIRRFWLHTCTFDHPAAIDFYRRSGFRPYASAVEVIADPRLTGVLPRGAAPHVPLIEPG